MRTPGITPGTHLSYASGYIELRLYLEAEAEILAAEAISGRTLPTLRAWLELAYAAGWWHRVVAIAPSVLEIDPRNERATIAWAYAARELQYVDYARDVLLKAEPWLGEKCALLHYNLACYECLLGNKEEARRRLEQALAMEEELAPSAKTDPDLADLR